MAVSSKFSNKSQVKSISLPCRSHPTTIRIEQQLNSAKLDSVTTLPSAQTVCNGLSHLALLYKSMDDLLNSSTTRVSISRQQDKKWVEDLVEESLKFLDVCGSIREMVAQIKEHVTNVHCTIRRRRNNEFSFDSNSIIRKMKKDVKKLVASLKVDTPNGGGSVVMDSDPHQIAAVMKAVVGVSEMTVSVLESLLSFLVMLVSKPNRLSFVVSKLINKGMVACEEQQQQVGILNELESIDGVLLGLCKDGSLAKIQNVKCRLERVESEVECIESGLEIVFRRLIGTRTCLLNIMSQKILA